MIENHCAQVEFLHDSGYPGKLESPYGWMPHSAQVWRMKVRDLLKTLSKDGWVVDRTRGSHRQMIHALKAGCVTVAGHPSDDVHPKTLKSILKQAGILEEGN